ncbi:hypothetical protein CRYUN_Cryun27aG0023200 [Craigia yunnanensis]
METQTLELSRWRLYDFVLLSNRRSPSFSSRGIGFLWIWFGMLFSSLPYGVSNFSIYGKNINGDALHDSMGLPPALNVTTAKVGKLEIILPYVSNVQIEPIVVQIDRPDLVLVENPDVDSPRSSSSMQSSTTSGKGNGYGFADKIADGMTLQVQTVNLLLETRGGAHCKGGQLVDICIRASCFLLVLLGCYETLLLKDRLVLFCVCLLESPMASITMRNILLNTTNENWQVVNLKEARFLLLWTTYFFASRTLICFLFGCFVFHTWTQPHFNKRFLCVHFGVVYNIFLDLDFGSLKVKSSRVNGWKCEESDCRGRANCLHSFILPSSTHPPSKHTAHHFIRTFSNGLNLPAEFQLELLMQSLLFSQDVLFLRASVSDGENSRNLSKVMIDGLFSRDTFSRPPCTLLQPSMKAVADSCLHLPNFGKNFCPPIYPLDSSSGRILFEDIFLLSDGIVVNPGSILPDSSVNSLVFTLKELDVSVPLDTRKLDNPGSGENHIMQKSFAGARLHIEKLFFSESPSLKLKLLNLEKDPACFSLWDGQPSDASPKKWTAGASQLTLSLETTASLTGLQSSLGWSSG